MLKMPDALFQEEVSTGYSSTMSNFQHGRVLFLFFLKIFQGLNLI